MSTKFRESIGKTSTLESWYMDKLHFHLWYWKNRKYRKGKCNTKGYIIDRFEKTKNEFSIDILENYISIKEFAIFGPK